MSQIESIIYDGRLPESFFAIPSKIYSGLAFKPEESKLVVDKVFELESEQTETILYTDHENIRLVGIFPVNSDVAYFGYWETIDDYQINVEVFKLFEADAAGRQRTHIIGPLNFNTFHNYRIRVGTVPSWGMFDREPVNPRYYQTILEQLGYSTHSTFESRLIASRSIPHVYNNKKNFIQEVKKIPFDFIPLNPATWSEFEDELYDLIHAIFSQNPFYKTISKEEYRLLYNLAFAEKLCPYASVLFKDRETGRLAAISLCHPNYSTLQLPEGDSPNYKRDFNLLQKKVFLAKSVGVHPDYRNKGLMNYLGAYGMLSFLQHYDEVIFCTMRSDNFSLHFTNSVQYEKAEYALYQKQLKS